MKQRLRLLIVEDSKDDMELLLHSLLSQGYATAPTTVDSPAGMRAALDGQEWDLIICDQSMPGFYVTAYLRSWAFEAQLRTFLREEYGDAWFTRRTAGTLLRELWELGQQPTADELLQDVTGAPVTMEAVAERIREALPA